MSLPAREPPPLADASLTLRFDDSDRDLLARAFLTTGDGPRAWRLHAASVAVRGPPCRPRLGREAVPHRLDGHREAGAPSSFGAGAALGPHHRRRGPSTQEPLQPELAVRRRPLEEIHAARHRDSGPERHGRALQPRHLVEARPATHVRSIPRTVRREPGPTA